ncbi:hypothetical protein SUGI_0510920 [Cryptomeria japonica]|nr:hypothetical protein SUGI_0510920 [Cryptomeria japonica]
MIVARCSIGFLIFSQRSSGNTSKVAFQDRIGAIQQELQQFLDPNEVVSPKSKEQQENLRISLCSITPKIVQSLPNETAHCAPKCERTMQVVSCQNPNVESATPPNAISSHHIHLHNNIVTGFHSPLIHKFATGGPDAKKSFPIEPIREGLRHLETMPKEFIKRMPTSEQPPYPRRGLDYSRPHPHRSPDYSGELTPS